MHQSLRICIFSGMLLTTSFVWVPPSHAGTGLMAEPGVRMVGPVIDGEFTATDNKNGTTHVVMSGKCEKKKQSVTVRFEGDLEYKTPFAQLKAKDVEGYRVAGGADHFPECYPGNSGDAVVLTQVKKLSNDGQTLRGKVRVKRVQPKKK